MLAEKDLPGKDEHSNDNQTHSNENRSLILFKQTFPQCQHSGHIHRHPHLRYYRNAELGRFLELPDSQTPKSAARKIEKTIGLIIIMGCEDDLKDADTEVRWKWNRSLMLSGTFPRSHNLLSSPTAYNRLSELRIGAVSSSLPIHKRQKALREKLGRRIGLIRIMGGWIWPQIYADTGRMKMK